MEWLKARAQVKRWGEEVLLLKEEMRRVLEFLRWKKSWWEDRSTSISEAVIGRGIGTYALRQADVHGRLLIHFTNLWSGFQNEVRVAEESPDVSAQEDFLEDKDDEDDA